MDAIKAEFAADRMVKIELEAAEALAALARSTEADVQTHSSNGGESANHRVESESGVPISLNLDQDPAAVIQQHCEKIYNFMSEPVKIEQYAELKPNPNCNATNGSSSSCKSRQNLTEAEKESRKLRRVLANRESARQTIRRRQAFYEELTRKAADLVLENENLKREKELAMKEFESSKIKNEFLKAQMTKLAKAKEIREEESKQNEIQEEESKPNNVDVSTSTTCPIFIYSRSSCSPFIWPSIVQPSNSVHPQAQMGPTGNPESYYMLPLPWLFPVPHQDNSSHPQHETCTSNQCSSTSEENRLSHKTNEVQTEVPISAEPVKAKSHLGNPPDGGGPHVGSHPQGAVFNAAQTVERDNNLWQETGHGIKVISATAGDANALPEKCPAVFRGKEVGAVAAAEARKRRKELTRLKNLHFRLSA